VFVAQLEGGAGRYQFPQIDVLNDAFSQTRIDARLFAEYRLSDTFGINTTLTYDQAIGAGPVDGPDRPPADPGSQADRGVLVSPGFYDDLEYRRFQAFVGVRLFW
jgi:hypothetical protein